MQRDVKIYPCQQPIIISVVRPHNQSVQIDRNQQVPIDMRRVQEQAKRKESANEVIGSLKSLPNLPTFKDFQAIISERSKPMSCIGDPQNKEENTNQEIMIANKDEPNSNLSIGTQKIELQGGLNSNQIQNQIDGTSIVQGLSHSPIIQDAQLVTSSIFDQRNSEMAGQANANINNLRDDNTSNSKINEVNTNTASGGAPGDQAKAAGGQQQAGVIVIPNLNQLMVHQHQQNINRRSSLYKRKINQTKQFKNFKFGVQIPTNNNNASPVINKPEQPVVQEQDVRQRPNRFQNYRISQGLPQQPQIILKQQKEPLGQPQNIAQNNEKVSKDTQKQQHESAIRKSQFTKNYKIETAQIPDNCNQDQQQAFEQGQQLINAQQATMADQTKPGQFNINRIQLVSKGLSTSQFDPNGTQLKICNLQGVPVSNAGLKQGTTIYLDQNNLRMIQQYAGNQGGQLSQTLGQLQRSKEFNNTINYAVLKGPIDGQKIGMQVPIMPGFRHDSLKSHSIVSNINSILSQIQNQQMQDRNHHMKADDHQMAFDEQKLQDELPSLKQAQNPPKVVQIAEHHQRTLILPPMHRRLTTSYGGGQPTQPLLKSQQLVQVGRGIEQRKSSNNSIRSVKSLQNQVGNLNENGQQILFNSPQTNSSNKQEASPETQRPKVPTAIRFYKQTGNLHSSMVTDKQPEPQTSGLQSQMNQRRKSFFYHMKHDDQSESCDAVDVPDKKKSVQNPKVEPQPIEQEQEKNLAEAQQHEEANGLSQPAVKKIEIQPQQPLMKTQKNEQINSHRPSYINNKKFDYITSRQQLYKRNSAGPLYDQNGKPVLSLINRSSSVCSNERSQKPQMNQQLLAINQFNGEKIQLASIDQQKHRDSGLVSEIQKQINQVMGIVAKPSQQPIGLKVPQGYQLIGPATNKIEPGINLINNIPRANSLNSITRQPEGMKANLMQLQKSLQSIAPNEQGLGPDFNDNLDTKSQPMVVMNNSQVIGMLGTDKIQAVPIQGTGNHIMKIATNPQIVPKQGMMTVLNQGALDKQLSVSSSIMVPNILCTTQLPQIANSNINGYPSIATHFQGEQQQFYEQSIQATDQSRWMNKLNFQVVQQPSNNVAVPSSIVGQQATSYFAQRTQMQQQQNQSSKAPQQKLSSSNNLYQLSLGPGLNLGTEVQSRVKQQVNSQSSDVQKLAPSCSLARSKSIDESNQKTQRRNQSQDDRRSKDGEGQPLLNQKPSSMNKQNNLENLHPRINSKKHGSKKDRHEHHSSKQKDCELQSQKTDSIWNQEMFDSIFSEKPKYFKHTHSNKNSVKSNDSLSNKGYSVSSMKGSKHENNVTTKNKRQKSQFLREVEEIRSEEAQEELEEQDSNIGQKRQHNEIVPVVEEIEEEVPQPIPEEPPGEKPKRKRNRKKRQITNCPHTHLPHYAKGMCNHCYHINGRNVMAHKCQHTDRKMYCKGLCQNCYFNSYNNLKRQKQ